MRRKPNLQQRRRELCDAAIRLLADDGIKGVSHLKVDRKASVPAGTTSFYFRTRAALLHAVAERVAELDLKEKHKGKNSHNETDLAAAAGIRVRCGSQFSIYGEIAHVDELKLGAGAGWKF